MREIWCGKNEKVHTKLGSELA